MVKQSGVQNALMVLIPGTASIAAEPARQFDLQCIGEQTNLASKEVSPWTGQFRVDLDTRTWCNFKCAVQSKMRGVSP